MDMRMYRGFVRVRLPPPSTAASHWPIGRRPLPRPRYSLPPAHPSVSTHCCCCFARSSPYTCSRLRAAAVSNLTDAPAFTRFIRARAWTVPIEFCRGKNHKLVLCAFLGGTPLVVGRRKSENSNTRELSSCPFVAAATVVAAVTIVHRCDRRNCRN